MAFFLIFLYQSWVLSSFQGRFFFPQKCLKICHSEKFHGCVSQSTKVVLMINISLCACKINSKNKTSQKVTCANEGSIAMGGNTEVIDMSLLCIYHLLSYFGKAHTKISFLSTIGQKDLITFGRKIFFSSFFGQPKEKGKKYKTATLLSSDVPWLGCTDILQTSVKSPSAQHRHTWDFWLLVIELCPRAGVWVVKLVYLIYQFVERHESPKSPCFSLFVLFNEMKLLTAIIISSSFSLVKNPVYFGVL